MTEGRYYVNRNIDLSDKTAYIFLRGDTELILGSGYTMSVSGLFIPEGHTLTIYNEYGGMGGLFCQSSYEGAGIGGGVQHNSGNIVIHGGAVYARGYDNDAGIGSAQYNSSSPKITIYDGEIYAYGGSYGAGIGGGDGGDGGCDGDPGTVVINDGEIMADGGSGACIGGGRRNGSDGSVTINGGNINCSGDYQIGSGKDGADFDVTLDYTNSTISNISITSNYSCPTELSQGFCKYVEDREVALLSGHLQQRSDRRRNPESLEWRGQ